MRRTVKGRRHNAFIGEEEVNPMNYMGNLSDVMLVLAVGVMLALVVAWNVDILGSSPNMSGVSVDDVDVLRETVTTLDTSSQKKEDELTVEDYGLTEYGTIYADADGNLYVLNDSTGN